MSEGKVMQTGTTGEQAKTKVGVQGVPETMLQTLFARAAESRKENHNIYDEKAIEIVSRLDYDFSKAESDKLMSSGVIARTIVLDRLVNDYLTKHPDAIVINQTIRHTDVVISEIKRLGRRAVGNRFAKQLSPSVDVLVRFRYGFFYFAAVEHRLLLGTILLSLGCRIVCGSPAGLVLFLREDEIHIKLRFDFQQIADFYAIILEIRAQLFSLLYYRKKEELFIVLVNATVDFHSVLVYCIGFFWNIRFMYLITALCYGNM